LTLSRPPFYAAAASNAKQDEKRPRNLFMELELERLAAEKAAAAATNGMGGRR
jgi:23S rRNA A1618 N6-methylase RlmF